MQVAEPSIASPMFPFPQAAFQPDAPTEPGGAELNLAEMPIDELRDAIRKNQVTFPAQVPTFPKHDRYDVQRQLVQLYFVLGWSGPKIGVRYGLRRLRVQQMLGMPGRGGLLELNYYSIRSLSVEVFTRRAKSAPLKVVLTSVLDGSARSCNLSTSKPTVRVPDSALRKSSRCWSNWKPNRTVADLAHEFVSPPIPFRIWKDQHEVHWLRHENAAAERGSPT